MYMFVCVQSLSLLSCNEEKLHWRLDVYHELVNNLIHCGLFQLVQPSGVPFCAVDGAVCGSLSCGETDTIGVQFYPGQQLLTTGMIVA